MLAPDYNNYGHSSWEIFKARLIELKPDVEIVGEAFSAFMKTTDYTPFIKEVLEKKPDAVWSPLWGNEAVTFIKQGMQHDLFSKVKFFFPDAAALDVMIPMGKEMPEGIYMSSRYFFTTPNSDKNRSFVETYHKQFKEYPDYMAGESYAAVYFLKAAVERAKSADADAVVQAVEKEPLAWEAPEGWKVMRSADHAAVEDCVWGETGFTGKYDFAVLTNIQSIQGEEICRTAEELRQVRGK
ncbi:ABC transporter substrate-binding protein [Candidatus Electronema sp. PJ]|uniref:ABC transporter substrate-binding protein n=1 Tax=Candidatus Electronema sp. PJ TaxID=3401572 RepID=UPI003AA86C16